MLEEVGDFKYLGSLMMAEVGVEAKVQLRVMEGSTVLGAVEAL